MTIAEIRDWASFVFVVFVGAAAYVNFHHRMGSVEAWIKKYEDSFQSKLDAVARKDVTELGISNIQDGLDRLSKEVEYLRERIYSAVQVFQKVVLDIGLARQEEVSAHKRSRES